MEKLPIEISEEIFGTILWEDPVGLFQLRTVCKTWKKIIDQCLSRLFQLWQSKCSVIPEQSFNDIAQVLFPLSSKPWQKFYWKDSMLPHIPRGVYQAWKNLPNLMKDNLEVTASSISTRNSDKFPYFGMNDKYLAVSCGVSDPDFDRYYKPDWENLYQTSIYELNDLENPIREYELYCRNIDFYTVGTRTFVILEAAADMEYVKRWRAFRITDWTVHMSEFTENDYLEDTNFDSYSIVDNECFSFSGLTLTHQIFTDESFTDSTIIYLPRDNLSRYDAIQKVRIEGSQLQIFVSSGETSSAVWIFRYEITRRPDETLNFTPIATNFIEKVIMNFPVGLMSKKKPMDIRFYLKRDQFSRWFQQQYSQLITSVIVHANYIITGTKSGKILIFHRGIEEIMNCISQREHSLDYTLIDFSSGSYGSAAPIGLTFFNSTPRLILEANGSIMAMDFLQ